VTDMAPSNSCPPFFAPSTACERRIAPAQVPHIGLVFTNSLSGSRTPERRARSAIVVLSVFSRQIKTSTSRVRSTTDLHRVL